MNSTVLRIANGRMRRMSLEVITSCMNPPCGACCTGQAALPIHLVGEGFRMPSVSPLPEELQAELLVTVAGYIRDGAWPDDGSLCIWYDIQTRKCKHYEHRPELCRDGLQVGDESCRAWRRSVGM